MIHHQNNFATNLTSGTTAGDTTSPLNSIPTVDAPFYLAFDATNLNSHYEVVLVTSKTATNVNHAALAYNHTTAEEVRMVVPAAELDNLATLSTQVGGAWVAWTPTVTAETGAITSYTAPGFYTVIGKTLHFELLVTITNKGTGAGALLFTPPVTPARSYWGTAGRESGVSGATFAVSGTTSVASLLKYDNTTLIATNAVFKISGTYEIA